MLSSGRDLIEWEVSHLDDLEHIRRIFNESLDGMSTKPLEPIATPEAQMNWWLSGMKRAWLIFQAEDDFGYGGPVGFIVLTDRVGFETPMFAIAPEYRGKGFARAFIDKYIWLSRGALAGEQLQSNEVICRLNKEAGWEILFSKNGVDYLFHPGSSRDNVMGYLEERAEGR